MTREGYIHVEFTAACRVSRQQSCMHPLYVSDRQADIWLVKYVTTESQILHRVAICQSPPDKRLVSTRRYAKERGNGRRRPKYHSLVIHSDILVSVLILVRPIVIISFCPSIHTWYFVLVFKLIIVFFLQNFLSYIVLVITISLTAIFRQTLTSCKL